MRILFSSDLHGNYEAYNQYSKYLLNHDLGILAGDQIDDYISEEEKKILGLNINKNDICVFRPHVNTKYETLEQECQTFEQLNELFEHSLRNI